MARYIPLPSVGRPRPRNLRLADLYLRQGEAQAEAELRSGDIKSRLFSDIGRTVGQTASSMIQAPQMAREQAAVEAERAQRTQMGALQLGEAERTVNERENYDKAMTAGSRQKTLDALKSRPELYEKAQGHFVKIDTSMKQLLGDAAAGIADFGYTPEAAMAAMDDLLDQGFDEKKIEPFRAAIQKNPSAVKQIADSLLSQSPDPRHQAMAKPQPLVELNKDTSLYDPNQGTVVAEGPKSPEPREPNPTEASLAMAAAAGDPAARKALALMRAQRPEPREPQEPLVAIMGPDGHSVLVPRSQAQGKRPASNREQGRAVTSGDAGDIAEFQSAMDDIAIVRDTLKGAKATGTVAKAGAMMPNAVTEFTGWGLEAKQKQAVIDRVKQVIGKALEGGVLRKEDELKYTKILPTIGDTPEVVASKLDGLEQAIQKRITRKVEALTDAGYDTGQFKARDDAAKSGRVYYDANGNPIKKP